MTITKSDAYFISDAHLGIRIPGCDNREKDLLAFLSRIRDSASHLIILGDFFDFWIEYGTLIRSDYFPAVHALKTLAESGTEIHYFAGNHDFALGQFLPRQIGAVVHPGHADLVIQGRRIHLFHGDGILRADVGYRLLRSVLRNRTCQALYKMLPASLGIALGTKLSGASRHFMSELFREQVLAEYRRSAQELLKNGPDIVVYGHTHRAEHSTGGGKTYCNTGEWIRRYNYTRLRDGDMTLWQHVPGGTDQELPVTDLK